MNNGFYISVWEKQFEKFYLAAKKIEIFRSIKHQINK